LTEAIEGMAARLPYRRVYHDLIAIPDVGMRRGIYWLRLYEGPGDYVAILTEVPGNPAMSVSNAIEQIVAYLQAKFGVRRDGLTLFEIWPRGALAPEAPYVSQVDLEPSPTWQTSARREIETRVGASLPELPGHAELYRRVRALGGGTTAEPRRPVFRAFPVVAFPPPAPFRCAHAARYERILRSIRRGADQDVDARREAGCRFLASLTEADRAVCPYHAGDWKSVAEESVRIIETLGPQDPDAYIRAASGSDLPPRERRWLVSLFRDPIEASEGGYIDGQHRACALRFSGASHAAAVTGWETMAEEPDDWIYGGDG
jgi:hypothetical protein